VIRDPQGFSPYYLAMRAGALEALLREAEVALESDVARLFTDPLMQQLDDILTPRPPGATSDPAARTICTRPIDRIGGMASVGHTTLSVIAGSTATLTGSAVSYFDVADNPRFNAETLNRASAISGGLENALLGTALKDLASPTTTTTTTTTPEGETVVETPQTPTEALNAAFENALFGAWSGAGIPVHRLAGLAFALGEQPQAWSVLSEGTQITFTPNSLPGGTRAEVNVSVTVSHDDGRSTETGKTDASEVPGHLTRVGRHQANTTVYVDSLGLFNLSTLELRTTHPRSPFVTPILGQLPIVGPVFRFPRSARQVHHESLLIIRAAVTPTAMDVGRLIPIDPPTAQKPVGKCPICGTMCGG
jgi:hypothetical protein